MSGEAFHYFEIMKHFIVRALIKVTDYSLKVLFAGKVQLLKVKKANILTTHHFT